MNKTSKFSISSAFKMVSRRFLLFGAALFVTSTALATPAACFDVFKDPLNGKNLFVSAQPRALSDIKELTILAYNVENLFWRAGAFDRVSAMRLQRKQDQSGQPEPKSEKDIQKIRDILDSTSPDIAILTEVESLVALKHMAEKLTAPYKSLLIEGNDERGIDIGFLVKADIPLAVEHQTHKSQMWLDPVSRKNVQLFSRDLPALIFRKEGQAAPVLIVLGNHTKSMRDRPGDPKSTIMRKAQFAGIAKIIQDYQQQFGAEVPILMGGDFNTQVKSDEVNPIKPFLSSSFDVATDATPVSDRITHTFHPQNGKTDAKQMDDIQVSASLAKSVIEAEVYRYRNADGSIMPFPRNIDERNRQPSDHFPVIIRLSTQSLWGG